MYDVNYFKIINEEEQEQAERLAALLIRFYNPASVLDVGSATGVYLKPFLTAGITVNGVDYSPSAVDREVLQIPRKLIKKRDITTQPIGLKADLTLCIEVLEHIEEQQASIAIHHLCQTAKIIFFTAAQPGQGGVGHVNCQPKDYWADLFSTEGFVRDYQDEAYITVIMQNGYHLGWLTNNLMVFKKK